MPSATKEIKPIDVYNKIAKGEMLHIYDVRELAEYKSIRIPDSTSLPLSWLRQYHRFIVPNKDIYLVCASGKRAHTAAQKLMDLGIKNPIVIRGGLEAWQSSGLPVEKVPRIALSLDQQVKLAVGILFLIGIGLSYLVNASWILLSAFVAIDTIVSALFNTCSMATVLQNMPWNEAGI